jgi:thymidylate synthase ThyX
MIQVKILADSINFAGNRLTSFLLTYPRFIHADFMTHRLFSRNASSSRARPIEKLIEEAENTPAMPIYWGKNQKGMQAFTELAGKDKVRAVDEWNKARMAAIKHAKRLNKIGLHKQLVNRILEPFTHITVICTATEYGNFFNLRAHKDAMPEIQELAYQMLKLYKKHKPVVKQPGEWHLPFADKHIKKGLSQQQLLKIVTARAARLSYLNFDGDIQPEKDFELHDRLMSSGHWSPFEHAAMAYKTSKRSGNFIGWKQYRKLFKNEHQKRFDANTLLNERGNI